MYQDSPFQVPSNRFGQAGTDLPGTQLLPKETDQEDPGYKQAQEGAGSAADRVNTHVTLSVLVMQAVALAKVKAGRVDKIRVCVRPTG